MTSSQTISKRASTFLSIPTTSDTSTMMLDQPQGVSHAMYELMRAAGYPVEVFADRFASCRWPCKSNDFENWEADLQKAILLDPLPKINEEMDSQTFKVHVLTRSQLGFTPSDGFVCSPDLDEELESFEVYEDESYDDFKSRVAYHIFGCKADAIRLFVLVKRWNRGSLLHPLSGSFPPISLGDLIEQNGSGTAVTQFYIQGIPALPPSLTHVPHVLVFLGQYDQDKRWEDYQSLSDFWQVYIPKFSSTEYIINILMKLKNMGPSCGVNLYLDRENVRYNALHQNYMPISGKIRLYDGAILWYDVVPLLPPGL
ncbi:hypothetical protein DL96DRAFT_1615133 [Flagelloscypha sp. PMI_526]|nr:hypothetical protein DL96DRAFT_1615133 [Flagelloscypha sp. PMI_526]